MTGQDLIFQQLHAAHRRLRIAVVTETYPPEINGVAMTMGMLVRAMQAREHQVQLIRPRQGPNDTAEAQANLEQVLRPGIPIPRYSGLKMGLPAKSTLLRLWSLQRPDVVHIATEGPLGWSALAAAHKLKLPVCSDFHTNFHSYSNHYGLGWLNKPITAYLRKFHNRSAVTLVPSLTMQRELSTLGYRNIEVVARGVDTRLFDPARRSAELRAGWGLGPSDLAVLYVGRMAAEKNLRLLVRAFELIEQLQPQAKLVLVGDGPELAGLQAGHPRFVFCGAQRGEALAAHYASADLFLFPSLTETFGNVMLEAMASGLAVLGFDYAAAAEHIQHGVNGLKAEYGNEADFIAKSIEICAPNRYRALGTSARDSAQTVSWDHIYNRFESILFDIVQASEAAHERAIFGLESGQTG